MFFGWKNLIWRYGTLLLVILLGLSIFYISFVLIVWENWFWSVLNLHFDDINYLDALYFPFYSHKISVYIQSIYLH